MHVDLFFGKKKEKKGKKRHVDLGHFDSCFSCVRTSTIKQLPISFKFQNQSTFNACVRLERRVRVRVLLCEFGS